MSSINKAASWKQCPIGELARKRKLSRESYLEADVKRVELVDKMSKRVRKS
jgi:hypothetical protein